VRRVCLGRDGGAAGGQAKGKGIKPTAAGEAARGIRPASAPLREGGAFGVVRGSLALYRGTGRPAVGINITDGRSPTVTIRVIPADWSF